MGTRTAPRFIVAADTLKDVQGVVIYADRQNIAQFADIDCNGKLDMLLGRVDGTITRYELQGLDSNRAPRFQLITEKFEDIQIIGQRQPSMHGANTMAVLDVDGDGDPDILWGDFGGDYLKGGAGVDRFFGGYGNDLIDSRDGLTEHVYCGDGTDRVEADLRDIVNSDCEKVVRRPAIQAPAPR